MMDIVICLVGGFVLGYLLGVRVTKHRVLTLLDKGERVADLLQRIEELKRFLMRTHT